MPFPFTLPTTSSVLLTDHFSSPTHPALPLAASTHRSLVKDALKKHKRLPPADRPAHLPIVYDALSSYLPYLLTLHTPPPHVSIQHNPQRPFEVEWRCTLTPHPPLREPPRPRLRGLTADLIFISATLAYTHTLLARTQLQPLHESTLASASLAPEQRSAAISNAVKHLLLAHAIHTYLAHLPFPYQQSLPDLKQAHQTSPIDIHPQTHASLASLSWSEATLLIPSTDDPYAAAAAAAANAHDTDWMFRSPPPPKKVRAHLFARLCLAAAEHAGRAEAGLKDTGGGGGGIRRYAGDLRRTARGRAARWLGLDAEGAGRTGEAIAWCRGGRWEVGYSNSASSSSKTGGVASSKPSAAALKSGMLWGLDAGRGDEARVLKMLETKWERENAAVNVQAIPAYEPLMAGRMPSGREYHTAMPWEPRGLEEEILEGLRSPAGSGGAGWRGEEEDSGGEEGIRGSGVGMGFSGGGVGGYY
ncbi:hypothetical protein M433DRAFT_65414 [Acidomyces richmondensis BFW]|nr:MAG: hypothetical protein FE78DRAFT_145691 [Acidomyces sp. 'richmondensis']KYG46324.1 hypothetical protein M433DRAFT_65414 [Acidomyces richmondensis BFW]